MNIRELGENDAAAYLTLRLRALKEHPTAFVSSYEEQKDWPLERFAQRLRGSFDSAGAFNLGVSWKRTSLGTVGFFREEGPKRMHIGKIVGHARGRGTPGQGVWTGAAGSRPGTGAQDARAGCYPPGGGKSLRRMSPFSRRRSKLDVLSLA